MTVKEAAIEICNSAIVERLHFWISNSGGAILYRNGETLTLDYLYYTRNRSGLASTCCHLLPKFHKNVLFMSTACSQKPI